jgi:hypothetical protein
VKDLSIATAMWRKVRSLPVSHANTKERFTAMRKASLVRQAFALTKEPVETMSTATDFTWAAIASQDTMDQ